MQVDDAANSAYSLHDKHYPQFQQAKDQYLKVVENKVADLRESGISGKVGQAADNAKKLPSIVNKRTEVALDRVEDVINQVASYPVGELLGKGKLCCMTCKAELFTRIHTVSAQESVTSTQSFGGAAVQRVWTQAKPTADFAWKKYLGFHDVIVVSLLLVYGVCC